MIQRSHNDSILAETTGKTIAERLDDLTQIEIAALTESQKDFLQRGSQKAAQQNFSRLMTESWRH